MRGIFRIPVSSILITCIFSMIYFQVFWQYWFVRLLGGYVLNSFVPILFLFAVFLIRKSVRYNEGIIKKTKVHYLLILLICYLFFSSISICLNEQGLWWSSKAYFIYIYSPVMIFMSISGMYEKSENIKLFTYVLFICGVISAIYVTITFSVYHVELCNLPVLKTNRGDINANIGGAYELRGLYSVRYAIPGMNSTTYGAMLVPLTFIGLYFRKCSTGKLKYVYTFSLFLIVFCMFMTVSRAAIIALILGIVYLAIRKWFNLREIVLISFVCIISAITFAKLVIVRIIITFLDLSPFDSSLYGFHSPINQHVEPRIMSMHETLSLIYQHPFFGMGLSNLTRVQEMSYGKEHNNYLSIAASFGTITLVFYIMFIISLFIMLLKNKRYLSNISSKEDFNNILIAGLLSLIFYLGCAPREFHFIWVWFGIAAAWLKNCEGDLSRNRLHSKISTGME